MANKTTLNFNEESKKAGPYKITKFTSTFDISGSVKILKILFKLEFLKPHYTYIIVTKLSNFTFDIFPDSKNPFCKSTCIMFMLEHLNTSMPGVSHVVGTFIKSIVSNFIFR